MERDESSGSEGASDGTAVGAAGLADTAVLLL